jgi:hypothetical protein
MKTRFLEPDKEAAMETAGGAAATAGAAGAVVLLAIADFN